MAKASSCTPYELYKGYTELLNLIYHSTYAEASKEGAIISQWRFVSDAFVLWAIDDFFSRTNMRFASICSYLRILRCILVRRTENNMHEYMRHNKGRRSSWNPIRRLVNVRADSSYTYVKFVLCYWVVHLFAKLTTLMIGYFDYLIIIIF